MTVLILRQRMLADLRIRNYSPSTAECYVRAVAEFAKHLRRSPEHLGPEEIRSWQLYLLNEKKGQALLVRSSCLRPPLFLPQHAVWDGTPDIGIDQAESA